MSYTDFERIERDINRISKNVQIKIKEYSSVPSEHSSLWVFRVIITAETEEEEVLLVEEKLEKEGSIGFADKEAFRRKIVDRLMYKGLVHLLEFNFSKFLPKKSPSN